MRVTFVRTATSRCRAVMRSFRSWRLPGSLSSAAWISATADSMSWMFSSTRLTVPGESEPVKLSRHSYALRLLQYVRDEAHRFAQNYHHLLRRKSTFDENS